MAVGVLTFVRSRAGATRDDRGDIILGWFTRIVVFLIFLGIIAFESLSLVTAHVNGADIAKQAADAAAEGYAARHTREAAYAAAEQVAIDHQAELIKDEFVVTTDGSVDLAITTNATSLLLYRTDTTVKWTVVKSSAHANARLSTAQ